jgi:signal transduction histidine kinase
LPDDSAAIVAALLSFEGEVEGGIVPSLQTASELCQADGCVLWLWHTWADQRLFPVAEWFSEKRASITFLPETSLSAQITRGKIPAVFGRADVEHVLGYEPDYDLMKALGAQSCCIVPVLRRQAPGDKGEYVGCLGFYRHQSGSYPEAARDLAAKLSRVVFQRIEDTQHRNTINLLRAVDEELHLKTLNAEQLRIFSDPFKQKLSNILRLLLRTFNCLEGAIYLQIPAENSPQLRLAAGLADTPYTFKEVYEPGEGLTGRCFQEKNHIYVPDLRRYKEEELGASWTAMIDPNRPVDGQQRVNEELPSLSFLAVPIFDSGSVLGVLRCSIARSAPYYFTSDQAKLLGSVANQVGDWCGNIFSFWRTHFYVEGMSLLNQRAHDVIWRGDHNVLLRQAFKTIADAIPEAHSCCLRLVDDKRTQLHFSSHHPDLNDISGGAASRRLQTTALPLGRSTNFPSAAADAFEGRKVIEVRTFKNHPRYQNYFFKEETDALVVAPVFSGQANYGTIETRFRQGDHISKQAVAMLKLLGRQLGLFFYLGDRVRAHDASTEKLNATLKVQQETFENLEHQLQSPLIVANLKAARLFRDLASDSPMSTTRFMEEFLSLRGNLRQAEQVAASVELFVTLANGLPIAVDCQTLTRQVLLDRFDRAIRELNAIRTRKICFEADRGSFSVLDTTIVQLDLNLLDQVIDNLLDNAEKYGKPKSTAYVAVGITHQGKYFYISIGNQGLPVTQQKAQKLMERGERSDQAIAGGQEGSGLGLYLVNNIMRSHGGYLEILPTDRQGFAYFRLLFPTGLRS